MNNRPPNCKAYERGDQWFCDQCGITWDMNDDDPPECNPVVKAGILIHRGNTEPVKAHRAIGNKALTAIKENLNRE